MPRLVLMLALLAGSVPAQPLNGRIKPILKQNNRVHWGVHAVQLKNGKVLMSHNADLFFIPASNTKLFATAYALRALGADYRFTTRVLAAGEATAGGHISGDLVLQGSGDPSLSSRRYPYRRENPFGEDLLEPLRLLARQLKARGIKSVGGQVIGDGSAFDYDPVPNGWAAQDGLFEYGAPVSALTFNDNIFTLKLSTAGLSLDPPVEYFAILNQTTQNASDPRRIRIERDPGSRTLTLRGNLNENGAGYENGLAVDDAALYAALAFRHTLIEEGITVQGSAAARHLPVAKPEAVELARRESPPLLDLLQVVNKVSQNLHAELVFRAAARKMPFSEFLKLSGVDEKEVALNDGSGMSRTNLVSPKAVVQLLRAISQQGQLEVFRNLLAIGGEDGTLRTRFDKHPKASLIRAKTGTLAHTSALGGYAESKKHGTIAFQIVANNFAQPAQEVRTALDRIALALLQ
ncbi:MAG: D-alanyl-D-alanine carboxypeptidase/D-alanyl-D-alanine-endopeptidase [Bryobacter sp.]|nr:D-alanyl-D-alanine carboxypeptidase/D-alanyl-D-alanine-endopeptidase [Bryobacter sp. CoA8 C33]